MMKEEENLSNEVASKTLVESITQSPTPSSIPPRNKFKFINSTSLLDDLVLMNHKGEVDVKMMKGKEKLSTKPSGVSITQYPTLPSLPPRNRFKFMSLTQFLDDLVLMNQNGADINSGFSKTSSGNAPNNTGNDEDSTMEAICWCLSLDGYEEHNVVSLLQLWCLI
ncbi:hypothetical protein ES332_D04G183400v1 [Gossypium tomentosum]|uniref:Uncharacterized protein n=1 Tax=Gossypium tomentosum TaxID=34277 RepID=A0A5D2LFH4_GOSTO|nr:hypothetical protein ES332_D04G183400v1 [Gossypium tomentosum]